LDLRGRGNGVYFNSCQSAGESNRGNRGQLLGATMKRHVI